MSELRRGLGLTDAVALVVGTVIGTGVFLKTATMTQSLGSPIWVMAAWLFAGVLSIAGALSYAELGSLFPKAGGEFVYLNEAYGRFPAFMYGWMRFGIGAPASIAAYAVGAATFCGLGNGFAVAMIVLFTFVNLFQVSYGGHVQSFLTTLKILLTLGLGVALILFSPGGSWTHLSETIPASEFSLSAFGAAVLAALWAYDGWNNLPMASGEVKDAQRNVPRALVIGILLVFLIYGLLNLAYFYALPLAGVLESNSRSFPDAPSVAANAAATLLGQNGLRFFSFALVISALGAMNGSILTGARVPYAMAKEGLFFKRFGNLHVGTQIPVFSVVVQGVVACLLALSGSFDQLTDAVVFVSWIFYAFVTSAVFILRKKMPDAPRAYKVVGYPIVPVVFIGLAGILVFNTIYTQWKESLMGLLFMALGAPLYFKIFSLTPSSKSE